MRKNENLNKENKTITFGGGCFWCTEAVFRDTKGVLDVKSGFSGGHIKNPPYREVCLGKTGHAEVIQVIYDPNIIHLVDLLTIHLLTHDPTSVNSQGADVGTQYRSIIFYNNNEEKDIAEQVIAASQEIFDHKIVTELKPFEVFYSAEDVHQNYYSENADAFYCQAVIAPKLSKFRKTLSKYSLSGK